MLRAGIAHFWFVTLHPFDDGNGRLTRTITDLALAQGEAQAIRFYAMSASILDRSFAWLLSSSGVKPESGSGYHGVADMVPANLAAQPATSHRAD
jgi:hypothetical protein